MKYLIWIEIFQKPYRFHGSGIIFLNLNKIQIYYMPEATIGTSL